MMNTEPSLESQVSELMDKLMQQFFANSPTAADSLSELQRKTLVQRHTLAALGKLTDALERGMDDHTGDIAKLRHLVTSMWKSVLADEQFLAELLADEAIAAAAASTKH